MPSPIHHAGLLLKPKRIGVRLALSYALLLMLFIIVILLPFSQIRRITKLDEDFSSHEMRRLLDVQALTLYSESVNDSLLQLLTIPRDKREHEYQQIDEKNRQITALTDSLIASVQEQQQMQNLNNFRHQKEQYQEQYLKLVDQLEQDGQEVAKSSFFSLLQPTVSKLMQASRRLLEREQLLVQQEQRKSEAELRKTSILAAALAVLATALAILLAWLTTRSVVRPLNQLQTSAMKIAAGDYQTSIPDTQTEEVTRVAHALNTMASAIAQREKEIEHLAYFDSLTELPNRNLLLKSYQHAQLEQHAIIMMDLARLKSINETLGFDAGDKIIAEVASRIAAVCQSRSAEQSIFLCKLSGGAFALLMSASAPEQVEQLADKIEDAMQQPLRWHDYGVDVSLVFGFAHTGGNRFPLLYLLRNAEVALYAAKHAARSSAWYSDAQEASRLSHLSLLSDLRSAVRDSELQIWLQPKVDLAHLRPYGFEALVRWQHPRRGFISPAEFIPFAERSGFIGVITEWMIENAIRQLAAWKPLYPNLSIAVNVSTDDLRDRRFPEKIAGWLKQYDVAPASLRLELTESGIMNDPDSAIALLNRLRDEGLSLSIDDFGTGHSSLAYLQRFPVDELKIDRSFVTQIDQNLTTRRLVKTIIEMGHGMHLKVIAEGVENQAERATLLELGCDAMQGYLVSKPLHGEALNQWLLNSYALQHP